MKHTANYDAVVVGSGPNGLSAAITLARQGLKVLVTEGAEKIGGGSRTAEATLPGFLHDTCSSVHPLAVSSRFFKSLELEKYGVEWKYSPVSLAHPLDEQPAVLAYRSLDQTAESIGADGPAYRQLMQPLLSRWDALLHEIMRPLRIPDDPFTLARFGLLAVNSAAGLANRRFQEERARALFAGMAGHSMLPLTRFASASFGLILGLSAHAVGWPVAVGGSQTIVDALLAILRSLGGEVVTGWKVKSLNELPPARTFLMDISPRQLLEIAGDELTGLYHRQLAHFRYGPGVFKVDWALDGPIPWRDEQVLQASTVHVGGTLAEIARSEQSVWQGEHAQKPYVLLVQASLADPSRAPAGKHTAWAYCHVPAGSTRDMRQPIEAQIERFAPGFRDRILAVHTTNAEQYEQYNPNYIGGDINAGVQDFWQFAARPVLRWNPYSTSRKGLYLCSSSTPPGGGVHGMSGYLAARSALRDVFGIRSETEK